MSPLSEAEAAMCSGCTCLLCQGSDVTCWSCRWSLMLLWVSVETPEHGGKEAPACDIKIWRQEGFLMVRKTLHGPSGSF